MTDGKSKIGIIIALVVIILGVFWLFSNKTVAPSSERDVSGFNPAPYDDLGTSSGSYNDSSYVSPEERDVDPSDIPSSPVIQPPVNEEESNGYVESEERHSNILVFSPEENASVSSPFTVTGEARVEHNKVYIRITNTSGTALIQESANVHSSGVGQYGNFKITLGYQFSATKEGFLEVYSKDNGIEQNVVRVPLKFN